MLVSLDIDDELISSGLGSSLALCPVACVVRSVLRSGIDVRVATHLSFHSGSVFAGRLLVPFVVSDFIYKFDRYKNVGGLFGIVGIRPSPFTFTLDIPCNLLCNAVLCNSALLLSARDIINKMECAVI